MGRLRKGWLARVAAIVAVVGVAAGSVAVGAAERRAQQTSASFFGVYAWNAAYSLPATEVSTARQIGSGAAQVLIDWGQIEFAEAYNDVYAGQNAGFDYTAISPVDARLRQIAASGIQPILLVANPPAWAIETAGTQGPLKSDKVAKYASFVRRLVQRYSAPPYNVRHVVLWPEPDARGTVPSGCSASLDRHRAWGDVPSRFVQMLQTTYPAVKGVRSDVQVIMGAVAYDNFGGSNNPGFNSGACGLFNYRFVDDVLAAGGAGYFDVFAFNSYGVFAVGWEQNSTGYDVAAKANYLRARFPALASKPLMVLEAGVWSSGPAIPVRLPDGTVRTVAPTEDFQADYPAKLFARGLSAGLSGVLWYGLRDFAGEEQRGVLDQSGNPKKAFRAFAEATTRLTGASYTGQLQARAVSGGTPEGYRFDLSGGGRLTVLWAVGAPDARVTLTTDLAGGNVRAYDALGNRVEGLRVDGDAVTLTVGNSPVYLLSGPGQIRSLLPLGLRNTPIS